MLERITWPTALAPGNVPEVVKRCPALYQICTTQRDQALMKAMPAFQKFAEMMPIEFVDTPNEDPDPMWHMEWFRIAARHAAENDAVTWNIWPDVVFTDNAFVNAAQAAENGLAGAVLPTIRVISETLVEEIDSRFTTPKGEPMIVSTGDAVRLSMRHMHPLSISSVPGGTHGRPHTSYLYRVENEGLLARSAYTWLYVDPQRIRMPWFTEMDADEPFYLGDTDPCRDVGTPSGDDGMFFLSLAPFDKGVETFIPNHSVTTWDMARMTRHRLRANSPFDDCFDRQAARLPYGKADDAQWAQVARRAETAFARVRTYRAGHRIWTALNERGHKRAAEILSLALLSGKLASRWPESSGASFFVPTDQAIENAAGTVRSLLAWNARRRLVHTILGLAVPGTPDIAHVPEAQLTTLNGTAISIAVRDGAPTLNGRANVVETFACGPHMIHIVDALPEPAVSNRAGAA